VYTPVEILTQATSINAKILRAEGSIGVIREGAFADLLLVKGEPLESIAVFDTEDNIALVMKGGEVVKQRDGW
jgi:imidazolonepropionase-like amidohydrolase